MCWGKGQHGEQEGLQSLAAMGWQGRKHTIDHTGSYCESLGLLAYSEKGNYFRL